MLFFSALETGKKRASFFFFKLYSLMLKGGNNSLIIGSASQGGFVRIYKAHGISVLIMLYRRRVVL